MNEIKNAVTFEPKKGALYFFDANIWIGVFMPIANYSKDEYAAYSNLLQELISNKSQIFISSLVLSEVLNRFLKIEFNLLRNREPSTYRNYKKDFRGTGIYKSTVKHIVEIIKNDILDISTRVSDDFSTIDINTLFDNLEESDFNDNYIAKLTCDNGCFLVTHDFDFQSNSDSFTIITSNQDLLNT